MARLGSTEYSPGGNKVFQFRGLTMSSLGCNGEFTTSKGYIRKLIYRERLPINISQLQALHTAQFSHLRSRFTIFNLAGQIA